MQYKLIRNVAGTFAFVFCIVSLAHSGDETLSRDVANADGLRPSYQRCIASAGDVMPNMMDCAIKEYEYQDERLNKIYSVLIRKLGNREHAELRGEERKWIKHRDLDCALGPESGQGQQLDSQSCLVDETARRATELEIRHYHRNR